METQTNQRQTTVTASGIISDMLLPAYAELLGAKVKPEAVLELTTRFNEKLEMLNDAFNSNDKSIRDSSGTFRQAVFNTLVMLSIETAHIFEQYRLEEGEENENTVN